MCLGKAALLRPFGLCQADIHNPLRYAALHRITFFWPYYTALASVLQWYSIKINLNKAYFPSKISCNTCLHSIRFYLLISDASITRKYMFMTSITTAIFALKIKCFLIAQQIEMVIVNTKATGIFAVIVSKNRKVVSDLTIKHHFVCILKSSGYSQLKQGLT